MLPVPPAVLLRSTGKGGSGIPASCCCSLQKMLEIFVLKTQNVANRAPELWEVGSVLSPAMASRNVLHLPAVHSALG